MVRVRRIFFLTQFFCVLRILMKNTQRFIPKFLLLGILVAIFFVLFKYFNIQELLRGALDWISDMGWIGIFVFAMIYILACVLLVPGAILTLGAGAIYGVVAGSILVSVASTLGATAAFLVGRYFARDLVAQKIEGNPKFRAVDEAVGNEGWKIVGLTRLSPIFPFNLLNYSYGLTRVSLKHYFFASWIGLMPGTVLYVYIGSLAGSLATLGAEGRVRSPWEWALYVIGLMATIAVTVYVTRLAKRALAEKIL